MTALNHDLNTFCACLPVSCVLVTQDDDLTLRVIGKPENQGLQFNFLTSSTKSNSPFEVLNEAEGSLLVSGVLQRGRAGSSPRG